MISLSLLCLTEKRSAGVERAKPVDFTISMPAESSSLTEKVCRGTEGRGCQREVQEQRPMQGKERKKRKRQDKVSAHLFTRDNGNGLGGQGSQAG